MFKRSILLFVSLVTLTLVSCQSTESGDYFYEKYKTDKLTEKAYYLGDDTENIYLYDNKVYAAGESLGYFDVNNNMEYTKLSDLDNSENDSFLFVNNEGIIYISDNKLTFFDDKNNATEIEITIPDEYAGKTDIGLWNCYAYPINGKIYVLAKFGYKEEQYKSVVYLYTYDDGELVASFSFDDAANVSVNSDFIYVNGVKNGKIEFMLSVLDGTTFERKIYTYDYKSNTLEEEKEHNFGILSIDEYDGNGTAVIKTTSDNVYGFSFYDEEADEQKLIRQVKQSSIYNMMVDELKNYGKEPLALPSFMIIFAIPEATLYSLTPTIT